MKSVFSNIMIGFMCLSLSSCCLFSSRTTAEHHHAAGVNHTERAVQTPIKTTANQNHLISVNKHRSQRPA